jgi:hypothetical protein
MGTWSLSLGRKQPGCGIHHPPPSSAKVKERIGLHLYSPSRPSQPVIGWILPLSCAKAQHFHINNHKTFNFKTIVIQHRPNITLPSFHVTSFSIIYIKSFRHQVSQYKWTPPEKRNNLLTVPHCAQTVTYLTGCHLCHISHWRQNLSFLKHTNAFIIHYRSGRMVIFSLSNRNIGLDIVVTS